MAKQLALALRTRELKIDWRALDRRARRIGIAILLQCNIGAREGFAIQRYAEDVALLEALRRFRKGDAIVAATFAASPQGHKVIRLADRLEKRVMARETSILCG